MQYSSYNRHRTENTKRRRTAAALVVVFRLLLRLRVVELDWSGKCDGVGASRVGHGAPGLPAVRTVPLARPANLLGVSNNTQSHTNRINVFSIGRRLRLGLNPTWNTMERHQVFVSCKDDDH